MSNQTKTNAYTIDVSNGHAWRPQFDSSWGCRTRRVKRCEGQALSVTIEVSGGENIKHGGNNGSWVYHPKRFRIVVESAEGKRTLCYAQPGRRVRSFLKAAEALCQDLADHGLDGEIA